MASLMSKRTEGKPGKATCNKGPQSHSSRDVVITVDASTPGAGFLHSLRPRVLHHYYNPVLRELLEADLTRFIFVLLTDTVRDPLVGM